MSADGLTIFVLESTSLFSHQPQTFCRFAMGGLFTTNIYAEHKTFGNKKAVCGVRNHAYCKCAVSC